VQTSIGPIRKLSWGALYPMIRRLEAAGLIAADLPEGAGAALRRRRIYRITEAGSARFQYLMLEAGEFDADFPDIFTIKLANLHHIEPDQRAGVLIHYQGYVRYVTDYLQGVCGRIAQKSEIPQAEQQSILSALEHRMHLLHADGEWVSNKMLQLTRASARDAFAE
jgi:DNA-binding PadR family transcriptional regulator